MKLPTNDPLLVMAEQLLLSQMTKEQGDNPSHDYWKIVKMPENLKNNNEK